MEEEEVESEEEEPEVEEEEEEEEEEVEEAEPAPKKKVRSKKKVQVSKKTTDKLKSEKDNPISSKKASVNAVLVANAAKLVTETGGVLNIRTDEQLLKKEGLMWKEGEPVSYAALCHVFESIEATTKRLEIQQHLTELFRVVLLRSPEDLYDLIYLASNSVAPAYDCIELGIGDSILIKAIVEASGSNTGAYTYFGLQLLFRLCKSSFVPVSTPMSTTHLTSPFLCFPL
jgi:DNA ligase-1